MHFRQPVRLLKRHRCRRGLRSSQLPPYLTALRPLTQTRRSVSRSSARREAPVRTIANNASFEGSVVVEKIKALPAGQGLDSASGKYGDMIEMGVLDPVKVTRTTLQNAASVAS